MREKAEQFEVPPEIIDLSSKDQDLVFRISSIAQAFKNRNIPEVLRIANEILFGIPENPVNARTREAIDRMVKIIGEYQNPSIRTKRKLDI